MTHQLPLFVFQCANHSQHKLSLSHLNAQTWHNFHDLLPSTLRSHMVRSHMDENRDLEGLNCSGHECLVGVMWAMRLSGHFGQLAHTDPAVTQLIVFALKIGACAGKVKVIQICCRNFHYPRRRISLATIWGSPNPWHTKFCGLHASRISTDRLSAALGGVQPCLTKWRKKSKTVPDVVRPSGIHIAFCELSCA